MACKVKVNQHGNLAFRIYAPTLPPDGAWEGTDLADTPDNRKFVEAQATLISREIKKGTFEYLKWFPNGNKAYLFRPKQTISTSEAKPQTVKQRFDAWIETKKPPFVRRSLERDYRQAFNRHIIPLMGGLEMHSVTVDTLEAFRVYLVEECKLTLKTARNIIDGPLRAMFRDAGRRIEHNPFDHLPANWWPRQRRLDPDPFTEQERDAILKFYGEHRPFKDYGLVQFRFYTGTRPSEAVALKWGSVDLQSGKARINASRTFGEDNDTKTLASRRTITLLPNVVEMLRQLQPLYCDPDSYVFTAANGRPVDQNEFGRKFTGVLRVLKLRSRRFYNARHTFISIALTVGCNQKWIAEQTGTSIAMIQEHYGRYIRDDGDALLRAYVQAAKRETGEPETETFAETFSVGNANYASGLVVPTAIILFS